MDIVLPSVVANDQQQDNNDISIVKENENAKLSNISPTSILDDNNEKVITESTTIPIENYITNDDHEHDMKNETMDSNAYEELSDESILHDAITQSNMKKKRGRKRGFLHSLAIDGNFFANENLDISSSTRKSRSSSTTPNNNNNDNVTSKTIKKKINGTSAPPPRSKNFVEKMTKISGKNFSINNGSNNMDLKKKSIVDIPQQQVEPQIEINTSKKFTRSSSSTNMNAIEEEITNVVVTTSISTSAREKISNTIKDRIGKKIVKSTQEGEKEENQISNSSEVETSDPSKPVEQVEKKKRGRKPLKVVKESMDNAEKSNSIIKNELLSIRKNVKSNYNYSNNNSNDLNDIKINESTMLELKKSSSRKSFSSIVDTTTTTTTNEEKNSNVNLNNVPVKNEEIITTVEYKKTRNRNRSSEENSPVEEKQKGRHQEEGGDEGNDDVDDDEDHDDERQKKNSDIVKNLPADLQSVLGRCLAAMVDYDKLSLFRRPVLEAVAPGYYEIIKNPMDFQTMRKKIEAKEYASVQQLWDDVELVSRNCMAYNAPDSLFYRFARRMFNTFGIRRFREQLPDPLCFKASIESEPGVIYEENSQDPKAIELEPLIMRKSKIKWHRGKRKKRGSSGPGGGNKSSGGVDGALGETNVDGSENIVGDVGTGEEDGSSDAIKRPWKKGRMTVDKLLGVGTVRIEGSRKKNPSTKLLEANSSKEVTIDGRRNWRVVPAPSLSVPKPFSSPELLFSNLSATPLTAVTAGAAVAAIANAKLIEQKRKLSQSLRSRKIDSRCGVCFGSFEFAEINGVLNSDLPVMECKTCGTCCHAECLSMLPNSISPEARNNWQCDYCKLLKRGASQGVTIEPMNEVRCVLCPEFAGILKPLAQGNARRFAHVNCALCLEGTLIAQNGVSGVTRVPAEDINATCCICSQTTGAVARCPDCPADEPGYHVPCALRNKHAVVIVDENTYKRGILCLKHTNQARQEIRDCLDGSATMQTRSSRLDLRDDVDDVDDEDEYGIVNQNDNMDVDMNTTINNNNNNNNTNDQNGTMIMTDATHADACCAVCGSDFTEATNNIIFCDGCNVAVHQACYGVHVIPEGDWFCHLCAYRKAHPEPPLPEEITCELCPNVGGAFSQLLSIADVAKAKKTSKIQLQRELEALATRCSKTGPAPISHARHAGWIHTVCGLWTPGIRFLMSSNMTPAGGLGLVAPDRFSLTCTVCGIRGIGSCIQCSKDTCYHAVHVSCALNANYHMEYVDSDKGVLFELFCPKHNPSNKNSRSNTLQQQPVQDSVEGANADSKIRSSLNVITGLSTIAKAALAKSGSKSKSSSQDEKEAVVVEEAKDEQGDSDSRAVTPRKLQFHHPELFRVKGGADMSDDPLLIENRFVRQRKSPYQFFLEYNIETFHDGNIEELARVGLLGDVTQQLSLEWKKMARESKLRYYELSQRHGQLVEQEKRSRKEFSQSADVESELASFRSMINGITKSYHNSFKGGWAERKRLSVGFGKKAGNDGRSHGKRAGAVSASNNPLLSGDTKSGVPNPNPQPIIKRSNSRVSGGGEQDNTRANSRAAKIAANPISSWGMTRSIRKSAATRFLDEEDEKTAGIRESSDVWNLTENFFKKISTSLAQEILYGKYGDPVAAVSRIAQDPYLHVPPFGRFFDSPSIDNKSLLPDFGSGKTLSDFNMWEVGPIISLTRTILDPVLQTLNIPSLNFRVAGIQDARFISNLLFREAGNNNNNKRNKRNISSSSSSSSQKHLNDSDNSDDSDNAVDSSGVDIEELSLLDVTRIILSKFQMFLLAEVQGSIVGIAHSVYLESKKTGAWAENSQSEAASSRRSTSGSGQGRHTGSNLLYIPRVLIMESPSSSSNTVSSPTASEIVSSPTKSDVPDEDDPVLLLRTKIFSGLVVLSYCLRPSLVPDAGFVKVESKAKSCLSHSLGLTPFPRNSETQMRIGTTTNNTTTNNTTTNNNNSNGIDLQAFLGKLSAVEEFQPLPNGCHTLVVKDFAKFEYSEKFGRFEADLKITPIEKNGLELMDVTSSKIPHGSIKINEEDDEEEEEATIENKFPVISPNSTPYMHIQLCVNNDKQKQQEETKVEEEEEEEGEEERGEGASLKVEKANLKKSNVEFIRLVKLPARISTLVKHNKEFQHHYSQLEILPSTTTPLGLLYGETLNPTGIEYKPHSMNVENNNTNNNNIVKQPLFVEEMSKDSEGYLLGRLNTLQRELLLISKNLELGRSKILERVVEHLPIQQRNEEILRKGVLLDKEYLSKESERLKVLQEERKKAEIDQDAHCRVCFGGDSMPGNYIIICDRCNYSAHQICANVNEVPEGDWFCANCTAEMNKDDSKAAGKTTSSSIPKSSGISHRQRKKNSAIHNNDSQRNVEEEDEEIEKTRSRNNNPITRSNSATVDTRLSRRRDSTNSNNQNKTRQHLRRTKSRDSVNSQRNQRKVDYNENNNEEQEEEEEEEEEEADRGDNNDVKSNHDDDESEAEEKLDQHEEEDED